MDFDLNFAPEANDPDIQVSSLSLTPDAESGDGEVINLRVMEVDGKTLWIVWFRMKRSTQMRELINAYCHRRHLDIGSFALFFDGRRLRPEQTPDELEMEDGEDIDFMRHQLGPPNAART